MDSSRWHVNCSTAKTMDSRDGAALKRFRWARLSLFATLLLVLMIPAPRGPEAQRKSFSVVSGDYISPLICSPRRVQLLNGRLAGTARFAGYDQMLGLVQLGSVPGFARVTRFNGDLLSLLAGVFILRSPQAPPEHPAYISEDYWKRVFQRSPDVLGCTIRVSGELLTISGVVQTDTTTLSDTEIWVPLSSRGVYGTMTSLRVVGELVNGIAWTAAEKEFAHLIRNEPVQEQVVDVDAVHFLPLERRLFLYATDGSLVPPSS